FRRALRPRRGGGGCEWKAAQKGRPKKKRGAGPKTPRRCRERQAATYEAAAQGTRSRIGRERAATGLTCDASSGPPRHRNPIARLDPRAVRRSRGCLRNAVG